MLLLMMSHGHRVVLLVLVLLLLLLEVVRLARGWVAVASVGSVAICRGCRWRRRCSGDLGG